MKRPSNITLLEPTAVKRAKRFVRHGDVRIDEYSWLQDIQDSFVREHVRNENAYADSMMAATKPLQRQIYREIRSRITEDDMSVPVKDGEYYYYSRAKRGKQYSIHCRKRGVRGREEIILDENKLAIGKSYLSLGECEVSPDHTLLAYTVDTNGSEHYTLYIKEIATGKVRRERIRSVSEIAWCGDSKHLYYTVEDHPSPAKRVYLHALGTDVSYDVLIYEEKNPQWYVHLDTSRSRNFIYITAANFDATEVYYLPSNLPTSKPRLLTPRKKGVHYFVEDQGDHFYIYTNERAVNGKIMRTPVDKPERKQWKDWISHDIKRPITGFVPFEHFIVVGVRENATEELYVYWHTKKRGVRIEVPEPVHSITLWDEIEYESSYIRYTYESFVTPKTIYDFYPDTGKTVIKKKEKVPHWNPDNYISERVWVKNGKVKVPVSLVYSKDIERNGKSPLLLEAYGSYGVNQDPYFSIARVSLLQRGWIIAFAHPRGGGELGHSWHINGYLTKKHRTYEDVIAVADYLVKEQYTSRQRLALVGGSAGGMMVGAVLNMRPDLCGSAIAYVPAMDVLTTSLDLSLGGTRLHYDETGDPRIPEQYFYLKRHSPYETIKRADYPALLVRASLHDIRTPYWEALKWVARLRDRRTGCRPLLLKIESSAGHSGRSGRYAWIADKAFDYAFLLERAN